MLVAAGPRTAGSKQFIDCVTLQQTLLSTEVVILLLLVDRESGPEVQVRKLGQSSDPCICVGDKLRIVCDGPFD